MIQDFINNIRDNKNFSSEEKKRREESLNLFIKEGFPSKKIEEWKFTDLNNIIRENFEELSAKKSLIKNKKIDLINDFEHNFLFLINGILDDYNFKFEEAQKFKISEYIDSNNTKIGKTNSLIELNNALFVGGFFLEIHKDYKFKKPLVVYNYFAECEKNKIVNNKNLIVLNDNSNLDIVDYYFDNSQNNFFQNNYTNLIIGKKASLKNYHIQGCPSKSFNYKYSKSSLTEDSNYESYIFSSGSKFNKAEENIDINGEDAKCNVQSSLFLDLESHQEIRTQINHLKPNCKSYQKIKNVLNENSKGAYQGKIFVKDVAQKTDAYQLSKALLLSETSEFNAKPELEIYADDVKCSHGSTSGSINEDSIYYLMTRGIDKKSAVKLLTKAFLFEVVSSISHADIKKFVEKNLDRQIYGH